MSSTSRGRPRTRGEEPDAGHTSRAQADVSALEAHLGYWLRAVSNHVSHAFKTRVERHGVTVAEWVVLRALLDGDGVNPSELAATLGLTRGAVSKLVDRLVAKDLLSVRRDVRDGRAQLVALKASGRRLVPKLAALADANDVEFFDHLTAKDRVALFRILQGIVDQRGLKSLPVD